MKLLTREINARTAARRWKAYYASGYNLTAGLTREAVDKIYLQLLALGKDPDSREIDKVIGSAAWTETKCSNCGRENAPVVELDNTDYFSYYLCANCANRVLNKITKRERA
jgi:DNA-directed RNA polymerase subunit RPC12/RpoP